MWGHGNMVPAHCHISSLQTAQKYCISECCSEILYQSISGHSGHGNMVPAHCHISSLQTAQKYCISVCCSGNWEEEIWVSGQRRGQARAATDQQYWALIGRAWLNTGLWLAAGLLSLTTRGHGSEACQGYTEGVKYWLATVSWEWVLPSILASDWLSDHVTWILASDGPACVLNSPCNPSLPTGSHRLE